MNNKIGKALVVGAGIGGIRTALDLAETGYGVYLIDHAPHWGGILSQLDHQFPSNHCGMCQMLPLSARDTALQCCLRKGFFHENIELLLSTELATLEGEPGSFRAGLRQGPTWVDPERCVGCGVCTQVCPVEVPDEFNAGLSRRKAIFLPVPHAIPNAYVIDLTACTRCGECERVCPTAAIRLDQDQRKDFCVLVVDDELIVRDSLKAWLDEEGFAVDTAESGTQALELLTAKSYQLMLTDIKMPGMDGVELLQKTKDVCPQLCVVMMTAYATVETAVEAMKIGALDYLVKPFDPEKLLPMVVNIYQQLEASRHRQVEVGAVVLCGGTAYYNPREGLNTYGYGIYPEVVTNLEFERLLSATGPHGGDLRRPGDGKKVAKIAWLQCVGSRNLRTGVDFCSSVCCMISIKEALLVKEQQGPGLETAIFYMDMRTFGKPYQRYRDAAAEEHGVRFERSRVHTIDRDESTGRLSIRYQTSAGSCQEEQFDLVVLAVGQRPTAETAALADQLDLELNPWGFVQTQPFAAAQTSRPGVLAGGAFDGLKDIAGTVVQASAAALNASRVLHSHGGSLAPTPARPETLRDVDSEPPRVLVAICTCADRLSRQLEIDAISRHLKSDPAVSQVVLLKEACTAQGWHQVATAAGDQGFNRIVLGACHPFLFIQKIKELARQYQLPAHLLEAVDIASFLLAKGAGSAENCSQATAWAHSGTALQALQAAVSKVKHAEVQAVSAIPVTQRALVVGGGIAGMTAALAVADHGFEVDLVERGDRLGGNLLWLQRTLEGHSPSQLLQTALERVQKHPLITVRTGCRVVSSRGEVGNFETRIETDPGPVETISHGTAILATGGHEATSCEYGYGHSEAIVTHKELEERLAAGTLDPVRLTSVAMIQCVGSREEPRNYCSRVCCGATLKNGLYLQEQNPDLAVYILYRDIMTYGFAESYYTRARNAGMVFIPYTPPAKPSVDPQPIQPLVTVTDPVLGRPLEIRADLVVLATGLVSGMDPDLAATFGAGLDTDGFFQEAESKWRPLDSIRDGIFACGTALGPRSITESIASAEAAGQRALRILAQKQFSIPKIVAKVRPSLCARCERCIPACPYEARYLDPESGQVRVNPAMCQGCGDCAVVCPNGAAVLNGFNKQQMLETIDAALG